MIELCYRYREAFLLIMIVVAQGLVAFLIALAGGPILLPEFGMFVLGMVLAIVLRDAYDRRMGEESGVRKEVK